MIICPHFPEPLFWCTIWNMPLPPLLRTAIRLGPRISITFKAFIVVLKSYLAASPFHKYIAQFLEWLLTGLAAVPYVYSHDLPLIQSPIRLTWIRLNLFWLNFLFWLFYRFLWSRDWPIFTFFFFLIFLPLKFDIFIWWVNLFFQTTFGFWWFWLNFFHFFKIN